MATAAEVFARTGTEKVPRHGQVFASGAKLLFHFGIFQMWPWFPNKRAEDPIHPVTRKPLRDFSRDMLCTQCRTKKTHPSVGRETNRTKCPDAEGPTSMRRSSTKSIKKYQLFCRRVLVLKLYNLSGLTLVPFQSDS